MADNQEDLAAVDRWLRSYAGPPVSPEWVPGASEEERTRLAALGGLVRELQSSARGADIGFDAQDLESWTQSGPTPPKSVLASAQAVLDAEEDGLAALYSRSVSSVSRRQLGTFFTPRAEVNWMLDRWQAIFPEPGSVMDVGAGVGAFTVGALRTWPSSLVYSVDVNPVTLGLLALRLNSDSATPADRTRFVLEDFATWAEREWAALPSGRLVLGNPPYTRLQLLPAADRERLAVAAKGLTGSRASLSTLLTAVAIGLLEPADGLCLLLPAQWLEADYAAGLRNWLWKATSRRIGLFLYGSEVFQDAQVDAVVLIVGPETSDPQIMEFGEGGSPLAAPTRLVLRGGDQPRAWRALFSAAPEKDDSPGLPLGNYATVKRGVATGSNSFFVMTRSAGLDSKLPSNLLQPLLRRTRSFEGTSVTAKDLLDAPPNDQHYLFVYAAESKQTSAVISYIRAGEKRGVHKGVLCTSRKNWYDLSKEVQIPNVIIGPATKGAFRFIENSAGAAITNNLYGLNWKSNVSATVRARILKWLRSDAGQDAILRGARTQGGGLKKIEPGAMKNLIIPGQIVDPSLNRKQSVDP